MPECVYGLLRKVIKYISSLVLCYTQMTSPNVGLKKRVNLDEFLKFKKTMCHKNQTQILFPTPGRNQNTSEQLISS